MKKALISFLIVLGFNLRVEAQVQPDKMHPFVCNSRTKYELLMDMHDSKEALDTGGVTWRLGMESAELVGGASKVVDDAASGGYLVSLAKPGEGIKFANLPAVDKLAIGYASTGVGLISVAVNNQPVQMVNIHSSGI